MPNIVGLAALVLAADTAAAFDSDPPISATQAILRCETNAVRIGSVDQVPTASTGLLMNPGDVLDVSGNDFRTFFKSFRAINAVAGANGVLRGIFYTGFDKG